MTADECEKTGVFFRAGGIDLLNGASGYCAYNRNAVCEIGRCMVGSVLRSARNFQPSIHPADGFAHRRHDATPVSSDKQRMTVRFNSSTLKRLSRLGTAPITAASAAARNVSTLARAPVITRSASLARQGFVATPPKASRALVIVVPDMAIIA